MLLDVQDIRFRYSPDSPPVLDGVSLQLDRGDSLAVVGPSGCGKSTLLNIIGTLERPDSGSVTLDELELTTLAPERVPAIRNTKIGFIFQDHHLLPQCTLLENVLLPSLAGYQSTDDAPDRARKLLQRVGLADRMHHRPGEISGGQRQRAAVVRALINRPALLLADEPTGSLDHASAESLADLLVDLNRDEGVSLIVVTHSQDLARRMSRTLELRDGKLLPAPLPLREGAGGE